MKVIRKTSQTTTIIYNGSGLRRLWRMAYYVVIAYDEFGDRIIFGDRPHPYVLTFSFMEAVVYNKIYLDNREKLKRKNTSFINTC